MVLHNFELNSGSIKILGSKESWSVEQKKIMDHFDDFTGGEKNLFASNRYIFGQNTPNDY